VIYIVEIKSGGWTVWHTITRIKSVAEKALKEWNDRRGGAKLTSVVDKRKRADVE